MAKTTTYHKRVKGKTVLVTGSGKGSLEDEASFKENMIGVAVGRLLRGRG